MATTYTVRGGDTLSKIAKLYNVPLSQITGYSSGDPNKIRPGEVLNIGGGAAPASPATAAPSPTTGIPTIMDTSKDFSSIYNSLLPSFTDPNLDKTLTDLGGKITQGAQQKADATRALAPTITNIYGNLAKQLQTSMDEEKAQVETQKTREIAKQSESAAVSGFETTNGYEAALARSIEKDYNQQADQVAQKWGLKREQLDQEQIKDLKQLEVDASEAINQGNVQLADLSIKIASIKQQGQQLLSTVSSAVMNAQNTKEVQYWTNYWQQKANELKQQELDLSAQKIAADASSSSPTALIDFFKNMGIDITGAGSATTDSGNKDWSKVLDDLGLTKDTSQSATPAKPVLRDNTRSYSGVA